MIELSVPEFAGNEWAYLKECLDTGWVSSAGKFLEQFEARFIELTGAAHAVAVINGTAALHTSLLVTGIKPGDEVIVPALTFIAPVNTIRYCQASPVFMDCDEFYNIDVEKVRRFLEQECTRRDGETFNKRTGARVWGIMPVHIFGNPVRVEELVKLSTEFGLRIVEDASEALGSTYRGTHVGTHGDMGCFSFNGNKIITTGGGGMIITNDKRLADRARYLTTQAKDDGLRYVHNEVGYNYRLSNVHAAIGVAQLERLPAYLETKRRNYDHYAREVPAIPGLSIAKTPEYGCSNLWFYCLQIDSKRYGRTREELMSYLQQSDIQTRPVWHLNHLQAPYRQFQAYEIEKASELVEATLNIPCSVGLTPAQVDTVVQALRLGCRG